MEAIHSLYHIMFMYIVYVYVYMYLYCIVYKCSFTVANMYFIVNCTYL